MSQAELGAKLGSLPQTTISRWERGTRSLSLEQVRDIEVALRLQAGTLSAASGYSTAAPFDPTRGRVIDAISLDPELHPKFRHAAVLVYDQFLKLS